MCTFLWIDAVLIDVDSFWASLLVKTEVPQHFAEPKRERVFQIKVIIFKYMLLYESLATPNRANLNFWANVLVLGGRFSTDY